MTRPTNFRAVRASQIVFGVLVVATFFAFFAAQRLKHSDALVHSVTFKRFISPNADGVRERGRVRFHLKKADRVNVEVVNREGTVVRTLASGSALRPGPHAFWWNGRVCAAADCRAVPDGAYRVRVTLRRAGRSFVPDRWFIVDTEPPKLRARVLGGHRFSLLGRRQPVRVRYSGAVATWRAQFLVYRVRGQRAVGAPVASFLGKRGSREAEWDQTVGSFSSWRPQPGAGRRTHCQGARHRGRARPAPPGSYVIVVRACEAAGNVGSSSETLPPRAGSTRGPAGVTLTGVQVVPPLRPLAPGARAELRVAAPPGGYHWQLTRLDGSVLASGSSRRERLRLRVPRVHSGLHVLSVRARRGGLGAAGRARTPLVIAAPKRAKLLVVEPAISWQATNPTDRNGDGFADTLANLPAGERMRIKLDRFLALSSGPADFSLSARGLSGAVGSSSFGAAAETTTDLALADDPEAALKGRRALVFTGDERWITPQLGTALRRFVERGGRVAFFSRDAFRRTVTLTPTLLTGPSSKRQRDIFGEAVETVREAPAPVVAFSDELGLLQGPTGLFTRFEQSQRLAEGARVLTGAGRDAEHPVLVAYRLGRGLVVRVGADGWQRQLGDPAQPNVAWTTDAILEVLAR